MDSGRTIFALFRDTLPAVELQGPESYRFCEVQELGVA
jgi:hypothetical protein